MMSCRCNEEGFDEGYNAACEDLEREQELLLMPLLTLLRDLRDEADDHDLVQRINGVIDTTDYRWTT